jgi:hypothetical protein
LALKPLAQVVCITNLLGADELAVGAIEHEEIAVAIGLGAQLHRLAVDGGVEGMNSFTPSKSQPSCGVVW